MYVLLIAVADPQKNLMTIFAPSISSLYKQIQGYGIDPDPLFRAEGAEPEVIFNHSARVEYARSDRIANAAAKLAGDPFFGLREAEFFRPAHLGALGFAWLASTTLRRALERLQRFGSLLHDKFEVAFEETDGKCFVWIDHAVPSQSPRERDDASLAVLVKMCRITHGPGLNPVEVYSTHDQPKDPSGYYAYFQSPVQFAQKKNGICLLVEWIDERLTGANEQLAQMNDHIVVKYLAHKNKNDIVNRVRASILEGIAEGNATATEAAADLHMTTRNLSRRLREHETSFKQLLAEVRQELAEKYLRDHTVNLTEIAFLLGFAEVSAFSRAYKRWTGNTPSRARQLAAEG